MQFGGVLPWKYQSTEFEKTIHQDSAATEFVRCPDPMEAGVVAKIIRKRLDIPKEAG